MKQVKLFAVELCLIIIVGSSFLPLASSQAASSCSPLCWNTVTQVQNAQNGILQSNVISEDNCKALCANNGTCIGVYWSRSNNQCWFQMPESYTGQSVTTVANYWSLSNCTGDCLPYCWKSVQNNSHIEGGTYQSAAADENTCKLLCSSDTSCIGCDWNDNFNQHCWFAYGSNNQMFPQAGIRHWDIIRNSTTVCLSKSTTTTTTTTSTSTPTTTTSSKTSSTSTPGNSSSTTPVTADALTSTTDSSSSGVNTNSENKPNTAVIVLGVLLGVSVLVIIGLIVEKCIKGKRKPEQQRNEAESNYQGLQKMDAINNADVSPYTELQLERDNQNLPPERSDI